MKCAMCAETMTGDVYAVCPECFHDKPRIIRDEDLRDEVAKAAFAFLVQAHINGKDITKDEMAQESYSYSDAYMTERARRREGR